ncbi:pilus assembly protein PilP [Vibrio sp. SCSIO 43137]|uniref:pilus assembly protein PilP n=1 Tax=Vibrio sp. SCSIO 43137 TaxID=3021011 RepID=UPI0023078E47|nr:pilus assembly protein PilP [Vibrio sp. SCSIO 43137]WCE29909.1 pilus assembly protein PilP [Vibrio sp. SCSIO 43137]
MKIASNIFTAALLAGCQANQGSLEQWYQDNVLIKSTNPETELAAENRTATPPVIPFNSSESVRLFFSSPKPQKASDNNDRTCKTNNNPNFVQLESERLTASLHYRGYLSGEQGLWALIEPQHGNYYRIKQGAQLEGEKYLLKEIKGQSLLLQGEVSDNFNCVHSVVVTLDLKPGRSQ